MGILYADDGQGWNKVSYTKKGILCAIPELPEPACPVSPSRLQSSLPACNSKSKNSTSPPRRRPKRPENSLDPDPMYAHPSSMGQPGDPSPKIPLGWLNPRDGHALDAGNADILAPDSAEPTPQSDAGHLSLLRDAGQSAISSAPVQPIHRSDADHLAIQSDALSASRREETNCTLDEIGTEARRRSLEELRRLRFLAYIGDYAGQVCQSLHVINDCLHDRGLWTRYEESELETYEHWMKGGQQDEPPTDGILGMDRCIREVRQRSQRDILSHQDAHLAFKIYSQEEC
ncbi:hypothetical protein BJX62DRAFT_245729 [Aspergillus germanicus]